jgi:allantoinase
MPPPYSGALPTARPFRLTRPSTRRSHYRWPGGAGLAVYLGFNIEHFAFGEGMGAAIGPASPQPDVLNYSWREYGNRVGAWRCLELFDSARACRPPHWSTRRCTTIAPNWWLPAWRGVTSWSATGTATPNARACSTRRPSANCCAQCRERMLSCSGQAPAGWLSPWISESLATPDLLVETGYRYTLNWCHDDQPHRCAPARRPAVVGALPQELNDIPMIVARQMDAKDFAQMIIDNTDEMLEQARHQPLVMGIALHPYIVGQPYRLRHLRRALTHLAAARDRGELWFTTPGAICEHAALTATDRRE